MADHFCGQIRPQLKGRNDVRYCYQTFQWCICEHAFEIIEDSSPISIDKAIPIQKNMVLLHVEDMLSNIKRDTDSTAENVSRLQTIEINTNHLVDSIYRLEQICEKL